MKKIFSILIILFLLSMLSIRSYADSFYIIDEFINNYISKYEVSSNEVDKIYNSVNQNIYSNIYLSNNKVILGDEMLFSQDYKKLIDGKKIGAVVNQTSINSKGQNIKDILYSYKEAKLIALFTPEHGIDGTVKAGEYISGYIDEKTNLPVYSLYGDTREPTKQMLNDIDVLLFDLQDIGSRTYTYISTMYKCMEAAKKQGITFVVLDRPNPVSCKYVEGFIIEDEALSFVGIDNMPVAHGMTVGELARFFNRKIGANLEVVPMKNYNRNMIWQDTGLTFKQTSPYIPDIEAAFLYMATGQSENMGIGMGDYFSWSGGEGINSNILANRLNSLNLDGVEFIPETKGKRGGVKLNITDYHTFNPAKTGYYIMATANEQKKLNVSFYDNSGRVNMFYKISGNKEFGNAILSKKSAYEIESLYRKKADNFREMTRQYYLYN